MHPFSIQTHGVRAPIDEAGADSLEAALTAVRQMVEDAGITPVKKIIITLEPGVCLVEGELLFSAAWR